MSLHFNNTAMDCQNIGLQSIRASARVLIALVAGKVRKVFFSHGEAYAPTLKRVAACLTFSAVRLITLELRQQNSKCAP